MSNGTGAPVFSAAAPQALVGKALGSSDWIVIEQSHVDGFADATGDHQWIHVDVDRARREGPFGGPIAHGFLTLSLVGTTIMEVVVTPAGLPQALNYGLDRVRFINPVAVGSRVRNHITLAAVADKGGGRYLLTTENTVEIEGVDKPALTATALTMVVS